MTETLYGAGHNSSGHFYEEESERVLGMTLSRYRAGGANTEIRFAVGLCSLGSILVAMSTRGVCAISLGDDPEALIRELQDRFPKARLVGGDEEFERLVAQVVGFVEAPALGVDLPLDIRGHGVPAAGLASLAGDTGRHPRELRRHRPADRLTPIHSCRSRRLCRQRLGRGDSVPSCDQDRRQFVRLPLGIARKAELLRRERDP